MKDFFPFVNGLEDPLLISHQPFELKQTNDFIRVVLSNNNHWVCLAGGLCIETEDICLFDSLYRSKIDIELGEAAKKMFSKKKQVIIRVQDTQKQKKTLCGHYALAFCTSLCFGIDPEEIFFDEEKLISHYVSCIKNKKITMYPYCTRIKKNLKNKILVY